MDYQVRSLTDFANRSDYEVIGIFNEVVSGIKANRPQRAKVLCLAQTRLIDAVLVTELSRWGMFTADLIDTAQELRSRSVSIIALSGLQFDYDSPQGKLLYNMLAGFAEFERDLISERVKLGLLAAQARGKKLGRQAGQTTKRVNNLKDKVIELHKGGESYRAIAYQLKLSKNTIQKIIKDYSLSLST